MGIKREGKYTSDKRQFNRGFRGNEVNGYPIPDHHKTMTNVTNEPSDTHKNFLKEEIMGEITEKLMEKIQDTTNQKKQDPLKKFQDITSKKNLRRHRNS
jgi:hypothetical protein